MIQIILKKRMLYSVEELPPVAVKATGGIENFFADADSIPNVTFDALIFSPGLL